MRHVSSTTNDFQARARTWLALFMILAAPACADTEAPTLCVFNAGELAGATPDDFAACAALSNEAEDDDDDEAENSRCPESIDPSDVLFVRHQLPDSVIPPGPLVLGLQTPCGTSTFEVPYADGVALWSSTAPAGADCALTVTAVLANSELRCTTATATSCANLVCPEDDGGDTSTRIDDQ
jgi:hypothetical protein